MVYTCHAGVTKANFKNFSFREKQAQVNRCQAQDPTKTGHHSHANLIVWFKEHADGAHGANVARAQGRSVQVNDVRPPPPPPPPPAPAFSVSGDVHGSHVHNVAVVGNYGPNSNVSRDCNFTFAAPQGNPSMHDMMQR